MSRTCWPFFLLALALAVASDPAAGDDAVDYAREIKPVLMARCASCHGALKQQANLRLDAFPLLRQGGESGSVFLAGNSGQSLLIARLTAAEDQRMPPEGEPLSSEQIAQFKAWIDQGASAPDEPTPPDPRNHWAFKPPVRPPLPAAAPAPNAVDAFLLVEQERRGLRPIGPAPRHVQLRRLYLDLVGLPPTRDELHAFLADRAPDAYEQVVERLLASPRHGERWGRHWMDVWRYSDWSGYGAEVRYSQKHIWRWRDWIVESLNADKGYDRMVVEMLAADEAAPADPQSLRATGFLARNWYLFNRNSWLDNTVEHTGKAFLGLTFNCARCHDHKYDPLVQQDYYRLRAVFEPHQVRTDRVPGQPDTKQDGVARVYDKDAAAPTYLFDRGNEAHPVTDSPLPPAAPTFLGALDIQPVDLPATAWYPGSNPFVQQETLAQAQVALDQAHASLARAQQVVAAAEQALAAEPTPTAPFSLDEAVILEDFTAPKPEVWETGPGQWSFDSGRLVQQQVGDVLCQLRSRHDMPQDFKATFRFKITGGNQWRSVGLSFDSPDDTQSDAVYLSAGGAKVQVWHRRAGADAYPAEAMKPLAVELGSEYTLEVAVRDRLLNARVNGRLELAYALPAPRTTGRLAVWAFDAQAEFLGLTVVKLPTDTPLAPPSTTPPADATSAPPPLSPQLALEAARAAAELAASIEFTAQAHLAGLKARVAADRARYQNPPQPDAELLAQTAGAAHRAYVLCRTREDQLRAEQQLASARQSADPADEKRKTALAAAEMNLAQAQKAFEVARAAEAQGGADYPPLGETFPATSSGRRLALARWITDRQNPLASRVAVNHIWLRHFGAALTPSVFDFGHNGKPPTHPELMDWLAVEFMERGWSMKHVHRLLVTSDAYRRDSTPPAGVAQVATDPDNRWYWRTNARRMEAETVRDSVLHVAGQLETAMGGPELDQNAGQTSQRRSIYFRHAYEKKMLFLTLFDGPSENECYERNESIIPQQALALANSDLALSQARLLARQLDAQCGDSDEAFIAASFEQVLCRVPKPAETAECLAFLQRQGQLLADVSRLTPVATGPAAQLKPAESAGLRARENLVHVLLNHHDFVTIR